MARRHGTAVVGYIMHSRAERAVGRVKNVSNSPSRGVGCAGSVACRTYTDDGEEGNVQTNFVSQLWYAFVASCF